MNFGKHYISIEQIGKYLIYFIIILFLYKLFFTNKTTENFFDFNNIPKNYNSEITDIYKSPIQGIPKIIHHICPKDYKRWNNKWFIGYESTLRAFPSPEFTHMYWYDDELHKFIESDFPWFLNMFNSYDINIKRIDMVRPFFLYKYGGIYLDMDIVCKKKLHSLLDYELVLSKSPNISSSYANAFFMTIPKNSFIKFCIDNLPNYVNSYYYFGKHWHIMNSTGSHFLTNMIKRYGEKNIKKLYVLDNTEFVGDCNVCSDNKCLGGTFFKHVYVNKTWNSFDSTIYNFMLCNYKKVITALIVLLIVFYIFFKRNKLKKYLKIIYV